MDLESRLKHYLSVENKKGSGYVKFGSKMSELDLKIKARFSDIDEQSDGNANSLVKDVLGDRGNMNVNMKGLDSVDNNGLLIFNKKMAGDCDIVGVCKNPFQSVVDDDKGSTTDASGKDIVTIVDEVPDSFAVSTATTDLKRRRECASGILSWIKMVAKNPYNPIFGTLEDISKWNFFTTHHILNQILLLRQTMALKMNVDSNYQHFNSQKKQKMHPMMYDTISEKLRYSQRIRAINDCSKKSILQSSSSSTEIENNGDDSENYFPDGDTNKYSAVNVPRQRKVLIGHNFQVDMNDGIEKTRYEADTKWLGTRIWPSVRTGKSMNLIEREPIGKGRSDSCGCSIPDSIECVKYHVFEKSARLMIELGPVYYQWKFDKMGEYAAILWRKTDEKKFYDTVKSNPFYLGSFWDEIIKVLANKGKKSLLNFYFNVFILRRRGYQNRFKPEDINSDDDEEPDDGSETII